MSLKRLLISFAAAALLAIGVAACGGDTKTVTVNLSGRQQRQSGKRFGDDGQDGEDHRQRPAHRPRLARSHLEEREGGGRAAQGRQVRAAPGGRR